MKREIVHDGPWAVSPAEGCSGKRTLRAQAHTLFGRAGIEREEPAGKQDLGDGDACAVLQDFRSASCLASRDRPVRSELKELILSRHLHKQFRSAQISCRRPFMRRRPVWAEHASGAADPDRGLMPELSRPRLRRDPGRMASARLRSAGSSSIAASLQDLKRDFLLASSGHRRPAA